VFPNPTNSVLNFKNLGEEIIVVEVFDLTGKLVLREENTLIEKLDLSNLNSGTFILNATHKKGTISKHRLQKN
jgi:hypothetical protein